jgi:hypothetical protein
MVTSVLPMGQDDTRIESAYNLILKTSFEPKLSARRSEGGLPGRVPSFTSTEGGQVFSHRTHDHPQQPQICPLLSLLDDLRVLAAARATLFDVFVYVR